MPFEHDSVSTLPPATIDCRRRIAEKATRVGAGFADRCWFASSGTGVCVRSIDLRGKTPVSRSLQLKIQLSERYGVSLAQL